MIRVGGVPRGNAGEDTEFCGLVYPDGDEISKHMAARLESEPFYQADKFAQALLAVKQWRGAVDCGAWVGGWSRRLGALFDQVIAIEANPANARCVRKNVGANVTVECAAIGDSSGLVEVDREKHGPNVGSRVVTAAGSVGVVPMRQLDRLESVHALHAIDYIKVHVNGMELKVLKGAVETIRKHRPVLTVVLKPALEAYGSTADEARGFLSSLGYRAVGGERPYEIFVPA